MPGASRYDWTSATDALPDDLGRRTVRGGIWAIGGQGLLALIQFASTVVLARLLLPADFGLVAMAAAVSGFVTIFTDLGLSAATLQRRTLTQNVLNVLFYVNLTAGLLVMAVLMLAAPLVASFYGDDRLTAILMVSATTSPILAVRRQHAALLQRHMQWRAIQSIAVGSQLGAATLAVALALWTDLGYWALVAQTVAAAALTTASTWFACSWRPGKVYDWHEAREPLRFGFHLSFFAILNAVHRQSDDVLIGWRWGAADLGQYNRAYVLLTFPLRLINDPIGSAVLPALSRLQDDKKSWEQLYLAAILGITLVSSFIGANLMVAGKNLVQLAFGAGWEEAGALLEILAVSMIPAGAMNTTGWVYMSLGEGRQMARWALISTPVWVLAFLTGLPFGAIGVASAYSLAVVLMLVPCLYYASRAGSLKVGNLLRATIPFVSIAILGAIAVKSTNFLNAGMKENLNLILQILVLNFSLFSLYFAIIWRSVLLRSVGATLIYTVLRGSIGWWRH